MNRTKEQVDAIQRTGSRLEEWIHNPIQPKEASVGKLRRVTFKGSRVFVQVMNGAGEIEGESYAMTDASHEEGYNFGVVFTGDDGDRLEIGGFSTFKAAEMFALLWQRRSMSLLAAFPTAEWMDGDDSVPEHERNVEHATIYTYGVISGTTDEKDVY